MNPSVVAHQSLTDDDVHGIGPVGSVRLRAVVAPAATPDGN
jgi:hypothetical protein